MKTLLYNYRGVGMTDIRFVILNSAEYDSQLMLRELEMRVAPDIPVYSDGGEDWRQLRGEELDVFVYDRCGRLSYYLPYPYSLFVSHYLHAALLDTYYRQPCGPCSSSLTSTEEILEFSDLNFNFTESADSDNSTLAFEALRSNITNQTDPISVWEESAESMENSTFEFNELPSNITSPNSSVELNINSTSVWDESSLASNWTAESLQNQTIRSNTTDDLQFNDQLSCLENNTFSVTNVTTVADVFEQFDNLEHALRFSLRFWFGQEEKDFYSLNSNNGTAVRDVNHTLPHNEYQIDDSLNTLRGNFCQTHDLNQCDDKNWRQLQKEFTECCALRKNKQRAKLLTSNSLMCQRFSPEKCAFLRLKSGCCAARVAIRRTVAMRRGSVIAEEIQRLDSELTCSGYSEYLCLSLRRLGIKERRCCSQETTSENSLARFNEMEEDRFASVCDGLLKLFNTSGCVAASDVTLIGVCCERLKISQAAIDGFARQTCRNLKHLRIVVSSDATYQQLYGKGSNETGEEEGGRKLNGTSADVSRGSLVLKQL